MELKVQDELVSESQTEVGMAQVGKEGTAMWRIRLKVTCE